MRAPTGTVLLVLAGVLGCAAHRAVDRKMPADHAGWPPEAPRIRLLSSLSLDADSGRSRIRRWLDADRDRIRLGRPYGVAWDGDDLIVADPDAGRVARIGPDGRITVSREGAFASPIGLAVCGQGIVVTDAGAGSVAVLNADLGVRERLATALERPTGVACAGEEIFVLETGRHRMHVLGRDGARRIVGGRGTEPGRFNFPTSIAHDGTSVWVGDTLNFRVQRLRAQDGQSLVSFGRLGDAPGEMPRIKGVARDRAGNLWVSDGQLDHVSLYDPEGALLLTLGGTGAGPGEFSFPAGIGAHPDGRVAVADSLNRRIQIFQVLEP